MTTVKLNLSCHVLLIPGVSLGWHTGETLVQAHR